MGAQVNQSSPCVEAWTQGVPLVPVVTPDDPGSTPAAGALGGVRWGLRDPEVWRVKGDRNGSRNYPIEPLAQGTEIRW